MDILRPYMSMSEEVAFENKLMYHSRFDDEIETLIVTIDLKHDLLEQAIQGIKKAIEMIPKIETDAEDQLMVFLTDLVNEIEY